MDNVIGGNDVGRDRNTGISQACDRERTRCGSDDGESIRRQVGKQLCRSGQGCYPLFVSNFHLFHLNVFFFGVELWRYRADGEGF